MLQNSKGKRRRIPLNEIFWGKLIQTTQVIQILLNQIEASQQLVKIIDCFSLILEAV